MKAIVVCAVLALSHCDRGQTEGGRGPAALVTAPASAAPAAEPPRAEEILASGQTSPRSLIVDNGFLYWVNDEPQEPDKVTTSVVVRLSVNGGDTHVIAAHQDEMDMTANQEVAVAGGNVYWIAGERDVRAIFAAPVTGGKPHKIASVKGATVLASDSNAVYWVEYGEDKHSALKTVPLSGGKAVTLSMEPNNMLPVGIALDAQYVYWISDLQGSAYAPSIKRTPRGGGASEVFSSSTTGNVRSIVADDAMVYAADSSEWNGNLAAKAGIVGRIQAFPKAGRGSFRAIAQLLGPWALAVDAHYVYFVAAEEWKCWPHLEGDRRHHRPRRRPTVCAFDCGR